MSLPMGTIAAVAAQASIVHRVFADHALKVNFGPGKTEAVLRLAGRGAPEARRFIAENGGIPINLEGRSLLLVVVPDYRHMGVRLSPQGRMQPEVKARAGAMDSALKALKARVLSSGP